MNFCFHSKIGHLKSTILNIVKWTLYLEASASKLAQGQQTGAVCGAEGTKVMA